ncbi:MAG: hypothetical protein AVDCRST_MAG59-2707 [uncultured Thermomicrobiales bacterium]|uniref:N-acetyltransferase domain-containing protein n=1 Tax=uncultured Thermomicrobiales bacterium TaxID=1645740 RepID=A0A6J4UWE5_9BACT|nr:MAG: hypothetical protein AVDCRST_MAG59-2707 [uncultured Thermomicrobiales bacterium]
MDGGRLRVEPVGRDDAPLVHRLTQAAFAEFRGALDPPSGADTETADEVAAAIDAGGAAVAWIGEEAVGAIRWTPLPGHLYVGRLAVLPAHRGQGVGLALVAFAETQAASLELPEVRVEARSALPENAAFFQGRGFVVVEERLHPRSPAATTVVLAKPVPTSGPGTTSFVVGIPGARTSRPRE